MMKEAEEETVAAQDVPTPVRAQRTPSPVAKPSVKAPPAAPIKSQQHPAEEDKWVWGSRFWARGLGFQFVLQLHVGLGDVSQQLVDTKLVLKLGICSNPATN